LFEIGTGSLLSSGDLKSGKIPRVSAKADNNGILGHFDTGQLEKARHFKSFITVNFFGSDGGVFYHPYKASIEMKVHTLKIPNIELNKKTGSFIVSLLTKSLKGFGYGNQLSSSKLKNLDLNIHLPTQNGEIDYDFMESFIAKLEAERIAKLEAYLSATGLKDYQLTKDEQAALDSMDKIAWGEFRIEDVLEWQRNISELNPLHLDALSVSDEKKYPFYGQATANNGIIEYRHLEDDVLNNKQGKPTILIHSNNQNTVYLDSPFYLKDGHGATSVLQSEHLDRMTAQFFMGAIKKVIFQKYTYNAKATKIELKNTEINLPIKADNTPDYDYMRLVTSAIQKTVIKDVVDYADRNIATHHEVIGGS